MRQDFTHNSISLYVILGLIFSYAEGSVSKNLNVLFNIKT